VTDADELPDSLTDAEREILEASEAIGLEDEEGLVDRAKKLFSS